MSTELEYVPYSEFVAGLSTTENPTSADKTVISNETDGPRAVPSSESALTNSATVDDVVSGTQFRVKTATGLKKLDAATLKQAASQAALAGNVAPAFDPTKPNDAGGYSYYKNDVVAYNGATYKFKVNHSSGAWNAAEVDRYNAGENLKFFLVIDNPEYLYAITDKEGVFLFGIKKDGSIEWAEGVPTPIKKGFDEFAISKVDKEEGKGLVDSIFANGISIVTDNPEYIYAVVDASNKFLFGAKKDGSFDWQTGMSCEVRNALINKVNIEVGKSLINKDFADRQSSIDNKEYSSVFVDVVGRLFEAMKKNGQRIFYIPPRFENGIDWTAKNLDELAAALKANGFNGGQGDWSDASSVKIPMPHFAVINFSGFDSMPTTKTDDIQGFMQFWDNNGNYFKKKVIVNAQGGSSLSMIKKNVSLDIFDSEWGGDEFTLRVGDWVEQDSFHLKAYYTDFLKGSAVVGYHLYDEIVQSRGRPCYPWEKVFAEKNDTDGRYISFAVDTDLKYRVDGGPICHPDGFPVSVYLNDEFYGLFAFQLKKNRKNYAQEKKNLQNIHLDGIMGEDNFFGGVINWVDFEVRNPTGLVDVNGDPYDGDNPKELSGTDAKSKAVKDCIEALSNEMSVLDGIVNDYGIDSDEFKNEFERVFDVDNFIDYIIFCDVTYNFDGFKKNWQWLTYDGVKWWICPYDLDCIFGNSPSAEWILRPTSSHLGSTTNIPTKYIFDRQEYNDALEERYALLREKGIVSAENFCMKIDAWSRRIGSNSYSEEYKKWPESPCNSNAVVDNHWSLVLVDGVPVTGNSKTYDEEVLYSVGEYCFDGNNSTGFYKFECVESTQGNAPISEYRVKDSIWRIYNWIKRCISNCDGIYHKV